MPHRILFVHQNAPAQFRHLIAHCAQSPEYEVAIVGEKRRILANFRRIPSKIRVSAYEVADIPLESLPMELRSIASAMRRGRAVALCLKKLRNAGFIPDVIYGHPGWGDMLHVRDVFPATRVVDYCEFYFNRDGQDLGFDPEFQPAETDAYRVRTDNMTQLASLADADAGISPTAWQRSRYPLSAREQIEVVHDGIDLERVRPDAGVRVRLPEFSSVLDRSIPVITYVSRNLEPYRGFHIFMRALPEILKRLPIAHVLIVGGDDVSYSTKPDAGTTYRQMMLAELEAKLDMSRVHFLGRLPYNQYLRVLQLSSIHVYLTYPFVLSWSLLEAMATGAIIVGSKTAPVEEVIKDGVNGYLVDFFSHEQLADAVCRTCFERQHLNNLRSRSVKTIEEHFKLKPSCLERQLDILLGGNSARSNQERMGIPGRGADRCRPL